MREGAERLYGKARLSLLSTDETAMLMLLLWLRPVITSKEGIFEEISYNRVSGGGINIDC